jgi:hypothetical protein
MQNLSVKNLTWLQQIKNTRQAVIALAQFNYSAVADILHSTSPVACATVMWERLGTLLNVPLYRGMTLLTLLLSTPIGGAFLGNHAPPITGPARLAYIQGLIATPQVDVTVRDDLGKTALHYALAHEYPKATISLLDLPPERGVDTDCGGEVFCTALKVKWVGEKLLLRLLALTQHVNHVHGFSYSPLMYAVSRHREAVLLALLTRDNLDLNANEQVFFSESTVSMNPFEMLLYKFVRRLPSTQIVTPAMVAFMRHPALDLNYVDAYGNNYLMQSSVCVTLTMALLQHTDMDVNKVNDYTNQPVLTMALHNGNYSVVNRLLKMPTIRVYNHMQQYGDLNNPEAAFAVITIFNKLKAQRQAEIRAAHALLYDVALTSNLATLVRDYTGDYTEPDTATYVVEHGREY